MADLTVTGEVVVNSEKAESAFDRVGDKASQMANEVASSAGRAGQAVDKIGDGAGASAEKFTRAESRISASIKRATVELELLGKTASQKLEFNIADKGLDAAKFEPALRRLREIEQQAERAQRVATGSLDKMGISAAQTAEALRGVPAQFTDIVISLQGGQAPLTVFLQQGGQLKDMFGGAGNAARALGGYVLGLVNPFTVAAGAAATLAFAYNQGSKEADAYRLALVTTGNAAGTTSAQLKSYAQEISNVVGTQGKAAESLALLASAGKVGAENLREAAQAAVQYERATGQAASKTAEQFASLRNEPLSAVLKLNEGMNFLTESTYKQIKSLEEQGRLTDAASVAQRAFADTLTTRGAELERSLGSIERGWLKVKDAAKEVKDAAKGAWDAILNVGRAETVGDRLSAAQATLEQKLNTPLAVDNAAMRASREKAIAALREEISLLSEQERMTRRGAEAEAQRASQIKAQASFDKAGEKFLTDKIKMERELAAARIQGAEAGKSQAEIEQRLAQIRESYAKKGPSTTAAENKELRDQQRVMADLAGVSSTYYSELANYQKQRAAGNVTEAQYVTLVEQLVQKQPFAVAQAKEQAEAIKATAKAAEEGAKSHAKYIQELSRGAESAAQQASKLQIEEEAAAIAAQGYYSLAQAVEMVTIARLREKQEGLLGNEDAYLAVQKEIEARERLIGLIGSRDARKASEDAARDAANDWKRTAQDIERSLTDGLMRGFESGKGFAKNLISTLKNMFSTLVLRPIISAIVNPVAGLVTGALGLSGAAQAATGGASALSSVGSGVGMLSGLGAFSGGLAGGFGGLMGSMGLSAAGTTIGGAMSAGGIALGAGNIAGGLGTIMGALGPIALAIGVLAVGLKRKLKDVGVEGTLGGEAGFEGRQYRFYKGGFLRSDKTTYEDIDPALGRGLASAFKAVQDQVADFAESLSLPVDKIREFTTSIKFSTRGLDESGIQKAVAEAIAKGSDELAQQVIGTWETTTREVERRIATSFMEQEAGADMYRTVTENETTSTYTASEFARDGEKAIDTLTRLATSLRTVNAIWDQLGNDLIEASLAGGDFASTIADAFGGLEAMQAAANVYFQNFYSGDEQREAMRRQLEKQFKALNLDMPDINSENAREQFRALAEAQDLSTEAGRKAYAALLQMSGAFASVTSAAEDAAAALEKQRADAMDKAFRGLERAVAKEKAAIQSRIDVASEVASTMQGLFDLLHDSVRDLYDEVESTRAQQAAQGTAFISQALQAALASGYLPDEKQLAEAISSARGGLDSSNYTTQFELDRDRLILAGQLSQLEEVAGKQLTDAQKTLRALEDQSKQLDETLEYWREQIDIANGTFEATVSVEQAIKDLTALMFPETNLKSPEKLPSGGGFSIGGGGGGGGGPSKPGSGFFGAFGTEINDPATVGRLTSIRDYTRTLDFSDANKPAAVAELGRQAAIYGVDYREIAIANGYPPEDIARLFEQFGYQVPRYEIGTNYVPRTGFAMLHEGEAVVPKAYNPAAGGMSGGRMEMLLEAMVEQNTRLEIRLAAIEGHTQDTSRATNGNPVSPVPTALMENLTV